MIIAPAEWPYAQDGARRDDLVNRYRYPIIDTPYPRFSYITAVVAHDFEPRRPDHLRGQRPTFGELAIIASWHEAYLDYFYRPGGQPCPDATRPFDIDDGANGRLLIKYGPGSWGCRHRTWTVGPLFVPTPQQDPLDLIEVLDREQGSSYWSEWKTAHPEIFVEPREG